MPSRPSIFCVIRFLSAEDKNFYEHSGSIGLNAQEISSSLMDVVNEVSMTLQLSIEGKEHLLKYFFNHTAGFEILNYQDAPKMKIYGNRYSNITSIETTETYLKYKKNFCIAPLI